MVRRERDEYDEIKNLISKSDMKRSKTISYIVENAFFTMPKYVKQCETKVLLSETRKAKCRLSLNHGKINLRKWYTVYGIFRSYFFRRLGIPILNHGIEHGISKIP
jgi:hypothetical protein